MPFDGHTDVRTQILLDARSLLARRGGWCKGTLHTNTKNGGDSFCIVGALKMSAYQHKINLALHPEGRAVVKSLLMVLGEPEYIGLERAFVILTFNDAPSRRKHEVLSLMDRAIEHLP